MFDAAGWRCLGHKRLIGTRSQSGHATEPSFGYERYPEQNILRICRFV